MRIDQVDFFYVAMPQIEDVGDGSQDALLVRVEAGGQSGRAPRAGRSRRARRLGRV